MTRYFANWKVLALTMIIAITIFPYIGMFGRSRIETEFNVIRPIEFLNQKSCKIKYNLECSKAVVFDLSAMDETISVIPGITTTTSNLACVKKNELNSIVPDSVLGIVFELNRSLQGCEKIISYFKPRDQSFASWYFPFLITLKKDKVRAFSNSINFYKGDLRSILAVVVLVLSFTLFILMSILASSSISRFKVGYYFTLFMTLINAGIAEKFMFLPFGLTDPRMQEFLGLTLICCFAFDKYLKCSLDVLVLILASGTIELLFCYFHIGQESIWNLIILFWGVVAIREKFSFLVTTFFILNCFYLLSVWTPVNIVPPYAGTLFFLFYYIGLQIEQIRIKLVNHRISQFSRSVTSTKKFHALIKLISRVHKIERISLAVIKNDQFENIIFTNIKQRNSRLEVEGVFNVISKVFATGKPMIHVNAFKDELGNKIANKGMQYNSKYFTSFPLEQNGQILGVVNFSNYRLMMLHDDAHDSMVSTFMECSEIISRGMSQISNKFSSDIERDVSDFIDNQMKTDLFKSANDLLDLLFKNYEISGYFSEITSENSLSLKFASGSLAPLLKEINEQMFRVDIQNEFGPIAIAFKDCSPVILQNWKPISDKISQAAANIYRTTFANSIMTIPIVVVIGKNLVRYMFWFQTDNLNSFSIDSYRLAKSLQIKFEEMISNRVSQFAAKSMFDLAGSSVISELIDGNNSLRVQTGVLLMVDLSKSTLLGNGVSANSYRKIIEVYKETVINVFKGVGFELQMQIGDALLLTKTSVSSSFENSEFVNNMFIAEEKIRSYICSISNNFYADGEQSVRFCSSFGDISCELLDGVGGGWKIIGNTINEVHKIESFAKQNRGGIYYKIESDNRFLENYEFKKSEVVFGIGNIVYLPFEKSNRLAA